MIDDTKPNCKIILPFGGSKKLAEYFQISTTAAHNYLSGRMTATHRTREVRTFALNEMDGRYINVVKPKASH